MVGIRVEEIEFLKWVFSSKAELKLMILGGREPGPADLPQDCHLFHLAKSRCGSIRSPYTVYGLRVRWLFPWRVIWNPTNHRVSSLPSNLSLFPTLKAGRTNLVVQLLKTRYCYSAGFPSVSFHWVLPQLRPPFRPSRHLKTWGLSETSAHPSTFSPPVKLDELREVVKLIYEPFPCPSSNLFWWEQSKTWKET